MYTIFANTLNRKQNQQSGSALIISIIVLVILGALGAVALEVADLNIFMAANDRDSKESFFYADSGANIGREWVKKAFDEGNSTFFENNANEWVNATFSSTGHQLLYHIDGQKKTYVKAGLLGIKAEGVAVIIGAGYEGFGKGLPHGFEAQYLIRSYREGKRNSRAEVDLGFRDIDN